MGFEHIAGTVFSTWALSTFALCRYGSYHMGSNMGFEHRGTATTYVERVPGVHLMGDSIPYGTLRPPRYPRRRSQFVDMLEWSTSLATRRMCPSRRPMVDFANVAYAQHDAFASPRSVAPPVPPARSPPSNAPNTTRPHPHPSVRRARQPVAQHDAPQHGAQSAAPASTYFLVPIESSRR